MNSGVNYIVNNTGVPSSEWGKYKPAGVNPDGPSVDFSDLLSGKNQEIVSKLTDGAKKTLQRLKANPNFISKRDWMDLTHELNAMGAISDLDYQGTDMMFHLVPLGSVDNPYPTSADMRDTLNQINRWPGNPLDYLDQWAFSLKKWGAELSWERNPDGTPKYKDLSPIYDQASACGRVSNLIKGLLAADIFASR
ncbi:hypothetical protein [uncultured Oscillibacter sp.]|uniref:hypothetical protein n=1 Tax=uncultured Oscillibacter sp. TaxID=876091 RepID=UPI00261D9DE2|nr:hypothetical protein [uncultured Oscillibacter sp.]